MILNVNFLNSFIWKGGAVTMGRARNQDDHKLSVLSDDSVAPFPGQGTFYVLHLFIMLHDFHIFFLA